QDRLFHISSAVKDILGYTPKEVMRNGLNWFVEQIDSEDLKHLNDQADQSDRSKLMPQIDYHFTTKTGTRCRLSEHRCLLHDSNGSPSFIIARVERT
ncbi:MAG: PAS domain-containing protein, partial [Planctomycetota bacterium]